MIEVGGERGGRDTCVTVKDSTYHTEMCVCLQVLQMEQKRKHTVKHPMIVFGIIVRGEYNFLY